MISQKTAEMSEHNSNTHDFCVGHAKYLIDFSIVFV